MNSLNNNDKDASETGSDANQTIRNIRLELIDLSHETLPPSLVRPPAAPSIPVAPTTPKNHMVLFQIPLAESSISILVPLVSSSSSYQIHVLKSDETDQQPLSNYS